MSLHMGVFVIYCLDSGLHEQCMSSTLYELLLLLLLHAQLLMLLVQRTLSVHLLKHHDPGSRRPIIGIPFPSLCPWAGMLGLVAGGARKAEDAGMWQ